MTISKLLTRIGLTLTFLACVANCKVLMYDESIVPEHCRTAKAIESNYTPGGDISLIFDDLAVYEAPSNRDSERLLIAVYDIFGFSNDNLKQVADKIAEESGGFRVILPDFYRGESWDPENTNGETMQDFMQRVGNWEERVKPDLIKLFETYKDEGVQQFSIYGMCWGGKVATLASIELKNQFKASGLVHPASVLNEEAPLVEVPMFLMPSQSEPDMIPFYEVLQDKFQDNCGHRRFDDMTHGFAGARGNFNDPINVERVEEVITTLAKFFDENMQ